MKFFIEVVLSVIIVILFTPTSDAKGKRNTSNGSSSQCETFIKSLRNIRSLEKIIAANKEMGKKPSINVCRQ